MSKINDFFEKFSDLAKFYGVAHIEAILQNEETFESNIKYAYDKDFIPIDYETLAKEEDFIKTLNETTEEPASIDMMKKYKKEMHCLVFPFSSTNESKDFLLIESRENIKDNVLSTINFFTEALVIGDFFENGKNKQDEKYKIELQNMRSIQAKLFPKFDDVTGMDIAAAFLPADLMSGNFFDGFHINKDLYVIITCDVSKCGPAAPVAGATIRALFRSEATKPMMPSSLLQQLKNKIRKIISSIESNIYVTIYQINLKTGKIILSSLGTLTTFFYTNKKNGAIDLKETSVGKIFSDRSAHRDINLTLDPDDMILFYSRDIHKASPDNTKEPYGLGRLKTALTSEAKNPSLTIIHSIINDIYEHTNYSQLDSDILLLSMKKKGD